MTVSIVVLTPDTALSKLVGLKKTSLIPTDIRKKQRLTFSIASYAISVPEARDHDLLTRNVADYLTSLVKSGVTGMIILSDNRYAAVARVYSIPCFTVVYDHAFEGKTVHNYLSMTLAKVLRAFSTLCDRFDDEKNRKLLILPTRNFKATEVVRLTSLFRDGVWPSGFNDELDQVLLGLRARQRPKQEKSYKDTYLVDDQDRYFRYGQERHAQFDTNPPHTKLCLLAGHLRFGRRFDERRHFNVSMSEARISGEFEDCHNTAVSREPSNHINMFANDFMT